MTEFKKLLKSLGMHPEEFSQRIGISYSSFKTMTRKKAKTPRWLTSFMIGYEAGKKIGANEKQVEKTI